MFKNWNPFRKKSESSGRKDNSHFIKQDPKPSNKENTLNTSRFSSSQIFKKSFSENKSASGTNASASPRPITLARRGSLKITRLKPVADSSDHVITDSFIEKSSFNTSSFKSDRSSNDVSIFNASGPLLGSPFIPQVKQALGFNDTLSPFGSPSSSRSRIKRSNTFHYAPTYSTLSNQGSLPVVRLGRKDRHSIVDGNALNSPNTVKIAPPDVQRFPTCRLTSIKERSPSTGSQAPDTQAIVTALREGRKRSFVHQEESVFDDIDVNQKSKRRRQESSQSTASSASIPPMPDNFPDLAQPGYTLTPIDSGGVKRPAAPSREPFEDHEISLAKRPKKDNKNDPIKSSLRSSKISLLKETSRKIPTRRHSISYPTRQYDSKMNEMNDITEEENNQGNTYPDTSDISMTSLRNQPTILLSSLKTNEEVRKSNDELFSGTGNNNDMNDTGSADNSMNTSLNSSTSKRLLFDGIKVSTKKRLSLYPSLNTSFKKVPVSNVVASAEDYEKDREEEQKRVTDMLKEITEEHEIKSKKEEKLSVSKAPIISPPTTTCTITNTLLSSASSKLSESSKPQSITPATLLTVTSTPASLTVNPVSTTTTTSSISKTLGPGILSSSLGQSSIPNLASTTSKTTEATTATPSSYTFKPVFGAASGATTATTSVVSSTTASSAPTGFSLASGGLGASSLKIGSGFDVPKTSVNVLPGTTVNTLLTNTPSVTKGFATSLSTATTLSFPSTMPTSHTANVTPGAGGFTFGTKSSANEKTPSFAFNQASQAVTSSLPLSTASGFNFGTLGQTAPVTTVGSNIVPPSLQTNSNFGQNQASTGGFGFGGATALSALSALSGLSSLAAPTTNPPPYSLSTGGQSTSVSSGMPKPVFNFGNTALAQPTSSASSTFGSTNTSTASAFGVNASATTNPNSGAFQFGTPMTPSTPAAPSAISATPSFGASSTGGFGFGQNKPATSNVQNTTGFSFGGGQLATANSNSQKPFAFGSAQSAPGGFGSTNPTPAFGSTNTTASFGNNQSVQASPFGTGSNTATTFGGANGSTFGSTQQTAFGSNQQNSSTSVFGQRSSTTTGFGNNTPQSTPSFGQSTSMFAPSNQNTSSFGQPNSSNTPFQTGQSSTTPAAPTASFQFGQTTPAKSNNPTPTFGQSNTSQNSGFNFSAPGSTPSFNFGGTSTPGPAPVGAFGTPTTPTNLFTPGSINRPRVASSRTRRGRPRR